MDYKERLKIFNSTEKYNRELSFISNLLGRDDKVLDYGCGIGTAVNYFKIKTNSRVFGYDINNFLDEDQAWFVESEPKDAYHHITFIHSIAHIKDINEVLDKLKYNLVVCGKITVITPNLDWINYVGNTNSDPTVFQHYTSETLSNLFLKTGYKILQQGQLGETKGGQHERLFIQVCRDSSL
jgi:2-polyprenyl-3-methyl-5-hydroxy-6-metoxy-1,4-benzoquinol methylase